MPWVLCNRTPEPLDSEKVRFAGGAAALTDALSRHLSSAGVKLALDCVVNRVSTTDAEGVLVEGVQVMAHPRLVGYSIATTVNHH